MLPWWILILVAGLASLAAWLLAANRERTKYYGRILDLEATDKSREARLSEMDAQVKETNKQLEALKAELQKEKEAKAASEARLQETQKTVEQQQKLLEQAKDIFANLRTPTVKGRWGEMTLRRVAELAGMSDYCDFQEQVSAAGDEGRLRPDMVVRLPAGRQVIVDAKAPLDAFQDAMQAATEEDRKQAMTKHARLVREHMDKLSSRAYWNQFPQSPEFVALFLPGESFFSGALEIDRSLIEDGVSRRVVLATPTTLIALLWAVANGWRWEAVAKNAEAISQLGAQVYERMDVMAHHLVDLGSSLKEAVEVFNRAVGSLESRLLPSVRKFKELGVTTAEEIPTLEPIDQAPRTIANK